MKNCIFKPVHFLLFGIGLLASFNSCCQSLKNYDEPDEQTIYINGKDSVLRFQTEETIKLKRFNPNLIYYWYKSNTILKTAGGCDGRLLNGAYTCFYADNNLKEKGYFKEGLRDGLWISWFENGKIRDLAYWKNGLLNGKHIIYDSDGVIITKEKYRRGKLIPEKRKILFHIAKGRSA